MSTHRRAAARRAGGCVRLLPRARREHAARGVLVAAAFGYTDAVSMTTIGAGAVTYIVGPVTGAAIGAAAGYEFNAVLIPEPSSRGEVGQTPWSTPKPMLVDMSKAESELGYRPAITWTEALPRQVEWLIAATRDRDWREVLPRGAQYLQFDYEGEDALVAECSKA